MINFVAGGMMGDFIQSLYAVKNICEQRNDKANIYITDGHGGDVWRFDLQKTYNDLLPLMISQSYVNKFEILDLKNFNEEFINLNDWRKDVATTHVLTGSYNKCWSEVLSECYNFTIPKDYKWLNCNEVNHLTNGKILLHRSVHRHNGAFPWEKIINNSQEKMLFLTPSITEWDRFPFKNNNKIDLCHVSTILEMTSAINSCKMFIGNQSAPFSIACALDIPRLVELDYDPAKFYMDEIKYSKNISWFLNDDNVFYTKK